MEICSIPLQYFYFLSPFLPLFPYSLYFLSYFFTKTKQYLKEIKEIITLSLIVVDCKTKDLKFS